MTTNRSHLTDLALLLDEAEGIREDPTSYTPAEIAGVALGLARVFADVSEAIEPLKDQLREAARVRLVREGQTTGKVLIDGEDLLGRPTGSQVSVTFPAAQVKLSRDFDADALREVLDPQVFADLFEAQVVYKPTRGFKDELQALAENPDRAWMLEYVNAAIEHVEPTPRVGFPKGE